MPIFEYKCSECNTKFEVLHKSATRDDEVSCPNCNSFKNKKLFSTFSSSINSDSQPSSGGCKTGYCGMPDSGCSSGSCGLN
jgi:putative FmdB family regulatory protein